MQFSHLMLSLISLSLVVSSCTPQAKKDIKGSPTTVSGISVQKTGGTSSMRSAIAGGTASAIPIGTYANQPVSTFGFWGDAMFGTGTGNYINDTHAISNVHYISANADGSTSPEWRAKILQAKAKNNKVILMLEGGLFTWQALTLSPRRDENIKRLSETLNGLHDSILGVYLIDEPFWKNSLAKPRLSDADVYANLKEAATIVKFHFPSAVVMLTEAAPVIGEMNVKFPKEIDWIGPNCYLYYTECKTVADLESLYHKLYDTFLPNQKMIFTLDGHWMNKAEAKTIDVQRNLIQRNEDILRLSTQFKTAAFFPFIWQSQDDMTGTADMPYLKDYFVKLGTAMKSGNFKPGLSCIILEPTCEGKDWVRRDTCGKEIGRWVNAPAEYCPVVATAPAPLPAPVPTAECKVLEPTCEGKDYVRRDSCNKEIERWKNAPIPYCPAGGAPAPAPVPTVPAPAPMPTASCVVKDPACENKDWVRRDTCGRELGRWLNAPKDYCQTTSCKVLEPRCEVNDWVRRDSCGKEIERWKNAPKPYCNK